MGMFDNYDSLKNNYIPNNMPPKCDNSKLEQCINTKPNEEYNMKGELIGYSWHYGDLVDLEFNITGEIIVEDNAIIYSAYGQKPTQDTEADINTKAYNVIDQKSWTLVTTEWSPTSIKYIWEEDPEFITPDSGTRNIYVTVEDFMKDKQVSVQIFNFRGEMIENKTFAGASRIIFSIDKELSEKMTKSTYQCTLTVWSGETLKKTILQQEDCTLIVK